MSYVSCLMSYVSMLLTLKLDQLIWAAARGRHNDEMIRLRVHTRYSQFPNVGSFICLSIEHWVQDTLWLYVTCTEILLMKTIWLFFCSPLWGLHPGPSVQAITNVQCSAYDVSKYYKVNSYGQNIMITPCADVSMQLATILWLGYNFVDFFCTDSENICQIYIILTPIAIFDTHGRFGKS